MSKKFKKAAWTVKNEGIISLGKKGLKYSTSRISKEQNKSTTSELYNYISNPIFSITEEDILKSKNCSNRKNDKINSALWFVPYFDHITFGGIYTIFRFIEHIAKQGVQTHVVVFDNKYLDSAKTKKQIIQHFPGLIDVNLIIFNPENQKIDDIPESDISFSTIWMSAYFHLKYNKTKRKYYFIQDYEPLFYEGGSMYALAESTYRFGFRGVVNTPGLLNAVNQRHGLEGVSFIPAIDSRYYHSHGRKKNKKVRIFFYARPNNPRNAFELGVLAIHELIKKYDDRIEIVTAGAQWNEAVYGLKGKIKNMGLLGSLEEVGDLYRTCDIGFVFMLSKHPSYQPFEFMASGMATVTNRNEDNLWLFQDGKNCLLAEPSPAAMAEKVSFLVENEEIRQRISSLGMKNINQDWQTELNKIWNYIDNT